MAILSGGQAGAGGTAAPVVFAMVVAPPQYMGTPVDHEVIPQPPLLAWAGDMTVTDAPLGELTVTDST
jgi:hypothetical protein